MESYIKIATGLMEIFPPLKTQKVKIAWSCQTAKESTLTQLCTCLTFDSPLSFFFSVTFDSKAADTIILVPQYTTTTCGFC